MTTETPTLIGSDGYRIAVSGHGFERPLPDMMEVISRAVLDAHQLSPEMMRGLGEAMSAPLRRNLDYQGFARRLFEVEPLGDDTSGYYVREPTSEDSELTFEGADDFCDD